MAKVRLFAGLRESAGTSHAELPGTTVGEVLREAVARFGAEFGRHLDHARVWVNGDPAAPEDAVTDGDEVALLPPVSGGSLALPAGLDRQSLYVAVIVVVLAVTTVLPSKAWFAAAVVGVAAVWAVDMVAAAEARRLGLNELPLLAAIFVAGLAVSAGGANGLGLAITAAVIVVAGWAVLVLRDRDLVAIASNMGLCVVAALATGGLVAAHAPGTTGNAIVGAFLATVTATGLAGWALARSRGRPLVDPVTGGSLAGVAAALVAAWLWDLAIAGALVVSIGLVVAMIAGRGLGSLLRTGNIYLVDRLPGSLVALDGPTMAAAALFPLVRLLL
ncbi:MAG TPA: MoaD/ThiS family protein [Acidimicrobiia bacterium]